MSSTPGKPLISEVKAALKQAIQIEKEAMDFYRFAGERVYDPQAKLTFKLLSKEEREHALAFYQVYPGDDLPTFEELMDAPPNLDSPWWGVLEQARLADYNELKTLALAIEQEEKLEHTLREMADWVDDPQIRAVYLANAKSTQEHRQTVLGDFHLAADDDS